MDAERGGHTEPDYEGTRLAEILASRPAAEPLIMPADEFAVVSRAWRAWVDGPARELFDQAIQKVADDASSPWRARAEAAEAKLAEIAAHCRLRMKGPGRSGISLSAATLILGIAEGSDEERNP